MALKCIRRGFTLIELAISLAIVALIMGGISVPVSQRITEQQYDDTQNSIDKAMEALVGFALLNGRLPCPDISTTVVDNRDGVEDGPAGLICAAGAATTAFNFTNSSDASGASWGDLPWRTLGMAAPNNADAWNNRLRYAVFTSLALASPSMTGGLATATIDVRCANPLTATAAAAGPNPPPGCLPTPVATPYTVSNNVAFVVYSVGANGWGSTSINNLSTNKPFTAAQLTLTPDQAVNAPETKLGLGSANVNLRKRFVMRDRTSASSNAWEFDDVVSFMPTAKLASILMNAGRYP